MKIIPPAKNLLTFEGKMGRSSTSLPKINKKIIARNHHYDP
jgi:hypothetical protein